MAKGKFTTTFPKNFIKDLKRVKKSTGISATKQLELAWRKEYKVKLSK